MAVVVGFSARDGRVRNAGPTSFYAYRTVSGYSDNIAFDVHIASCAEQGERPGQVGDLPQQHAADRVGGEPVRGGYDRRYVAIPLRAVVVSGRWVRLRALAGSVSLRFVAFVGAEVSVHP